VIVRDMAGAEQKSVPIDQLQGLLKAI